MDKVIKINSKQGGPFSQTSNLVDFDIPPSGVYDFSDSYINLVAAVKGVGDTDVATGNGVYNVAVNWQPNAARSVYNIAMVKSCALTSELQGSLEDIRRVDILRQNLNEYLLTTDQKESLEYQSLRQLTPRNGIRSSIFRELHNEGTVKSREVQGHIQIPMSQLFELGQLNQFPAEKMGRVRCHLELNLNRFGIVDASASPADGYKELANIAGTTNVATSFTVKGKVGVTYLHHQRL